MECITGSAKNYEHAEDKAKRMCNGGYKRGGSCGDNMHIEMGDASNG
jgi:hypothetical protein